MIAGLINTAVWKAPGEICSTSLHNLSYLFATHRAGHWWRSNKARRSGFARRQSGLLVSLRSKERTRVSLSSKRHLTHTRNKIWPNRTHSLVLTPFLVQAASLILSDADSACVLSTCQLSLIQLWIFKELHIPLNSCLTRITNPSFIRSSFWTGRCCYLDLCHSARETSFHQTSRIYDSRFWERWLLWLMTAIHNAGLWASLKF